MSRKNKIKTSHFSKNKIIFVIVLKKIRYYEGIHYSYSSKVLSGK